jgi:uncharacterized membrane protein
MKNVAESLAAVLLVMWVGGLWAIGGIAAPTLFSEISDTQLAGNVAGQLFRWIAWVGIVAGAYLLIFRLGRNGFQAMKQAYFWIVLAMLLLVIGQHFGIQPVMQALKQQALPQAVMESAFRDRFKTWHGISSTVYLLECLLGLVLVLVWRYRGN